MPTILTPQPVDSWHVKIAYNALRLSFESFVFPKFCDIMDHCIEVASYWIWLPAAYYCLNWHKCNIENWNFFPFLLVFFHQLILVKGIIGCGYFILYFLHQLYLSNALQMLPFQETYFFFLQRFIIAQRQDLSTK